MPNKFPVPRMPQLLALWTLLMLLRACPASTESAAVAPHREAMPNPADVDRSAVAYGDLLLALAKQIDPSVPEPPPKPRTELALMRSEGRAATPPHCEPWQGYPLIFREQFNGLKIGDPIFIPEGLDQTYMLYNAQFYSGLVSLVTQTVPEQLSGPFALFSLDMILRTWLRPCTNGTAYGGGVGGPTYPQQPCLDSCEAFVAGVAPFVVQVTGSARAIGSGMYAPANDTLPLNCTTWVEHWPYDPMPYAPASPGYTAPDGTPVPCTPSTNLTYDSIEFPGCNDEFKQVGLTCQAECPIAVPITRTQHDNIEYGVHYPFGAVGFVLAVLHSVVAVVEYKRAFVWPGYLATILMFFTGMLSLDMLGTAFVGREEMWCGGGTTFLFDFVHHSEVNSHGQPLYYNLDISGFSTTSAVCTLQGFDRFWTLSSIFMLVPEIILVVLMLLFWNTYLAVDEFLDMHLRGWFRCTVVQHLVLLPLPLCALGALVLAAAGRFGFGPGSVSCFILPSDTDYMFAFWVPILLCSAVTTILLLCVVVGRIVWIYASRNDTEKSRLKKTISTFFRLFVVGACATATCLTIIFADLYIIFSQDRINADSSEYVQCRLVNFGQECSIPSDIYGAVMVREVMIGVLCWVLPIGSLAGTARVFFQYLFRRVRNTMSSQLTDSASTTGVPDEELEDVEIPSSSTEEGGDDKDDEESRGSAIEPASPSGHPAVGEEASSDGSD